MKKLWLPKWVQRKHIETTRYLFNLSTLLFSKYRGSYVNISPFINFHTLLIQHQLNRDPQRALHTPENCETSINNNFQTSNDLFSNNLKFYKKKKMNEEIKSVIGKTDNPFQCE